MYIEPLAASLEKPLAEPVVETPQEPLEKALKEPLEKPLEGTLEEPSVSSHMGKTANRGRGAGGASDTKETNKKGRRVCLLKEGVRRAVQEPQHKR